MTPRYEIQVIETREDLKDHRVTDTRSDTRVATCYLESNALLVCEALNEYNAYQRPEHPPELMTVVDKWQEAANVHRRMSKECRTRSMHAHHAGKLKLIEAILQDIRGAIVRPSEHSLVQACVDSMEGYRREMNEDQQCDAEQAARAFLRKGVE